MLKTKFTTSNSIGSVEPDQWLNKSLVLSSKHLGWNEILVQQYQSFPTSTEVEIPALSNHWLNLPLGQPIHLTQKRDNRLHESIIQKGDCIFVPAGQPSYWHCGESVSYKSMLHIYLKPESIAQVAETSELETDRVNLVNCFSKPDLQLQQIAMLLLSELQSNGIMGRLYVESSTAVLFYHRATHYITKQKLNS